MECRSFIQMIEREKLGHLPVFFRICVKFRCFYGRNVGVDKENIL